LERDEKPLTYNAAVTLEPGKELLHYRLVEKIGEGGMGVVWRAADTKLNRDVAIKVLPHELAGDELRLARFQREATTLASLNHPNIASIYEVGEQDSTHFLVMELVEGEDLADRIERAAIPVDEALPIARQIAEALEAAHEGGVVHRDLKPANVRITEEGRVKVLDFGLARAGADDSSSDVSLSTSPTMTAQMTQEGYLLGTAAYMSPEQARGKRVDKRTDIWAFGVLVCEMLTGARVYEGETVTDIIAAVVTRDPDWKRLPASMPRRLEALLRRCLHKDPLQRLRDIGEARVLIDCLDHESEIEVPADPAAASSARTRMLPWILAAVSIVVAVATWIGTRPEAPVAADKPTRLTLVAPPEQTVHEYSPIAISPKGTEIVYEAAVDGEWALYRRSLDSFEPQPIPGTENGSKPFFSPSGDAIGFYSNGSTRIAPLDGGQLREVTRVERWFYGATWSPDGTIVAGISWNSPLFRMPDSGGQPEPLTTLDVERGDVTHLFPQFLPDGKRALFTIWSPGGMKGAVVNSTTGETQVVHEGGHHYRYSPDGYLLFTMDDTLYATDFDLDSLQAGDRTIPVAEGLFRFSVDGFAAYDVSATGMIAFRRGTDGVATRLIWVDRKGAVEPAIDRPGHFENPVLSPDGDQVAMVYPSREGPLQVGLWSLQGNTRVPITSDGDNVEPRFTPDGKTLLYTQSGADAYQLLSVPTDGSRSPEPYLDVAGNYVLAESFSPDGKYFIYSRNDPLEGRDLFVVSLDGNHEPRQLVETPNGVAIDASVSPDGRWVAYSGNEAGRHEIYVVPIEGQARPVQITTGGGQDPRWNPTGNGELFYLRGPSLMSVTIDTSAGSPRIPDAHRNLLSLEEFTLTNQHGSIQYDVAPDGERFLLVQDVPSGPEASQIHLVFNPFAGR